MKHVFTFLALLVLSAAALFYSLNPAYPAALGLDLKGGMRVTLEPDRDKMREVLDRYCTIMLVRSMPHHRNTLAAMLRDHGLIR